MAPFSLFLALKYLRPKRTFVSVVTLISVLGVLLGVAILVIVLSVMTGFDDMWREKILSFKPHLTVVGRYGPIEDAEGLSRRVDSVPGVTGVSPSVETRVLIQHDGRHAAPIVVGMDPERAAGVSRVAQSVTRGEFDVSGRNVVIGTDLAAMLGLDVGDEVLVYSPRNVMEKDALYLPEELTVAGIFDMGMRDFDAGFILTSLEIGQKLLGLDREVYSIHVMIEDPFRFEEAAGRVGQVIGPRYGVRTWKEVDSLLFDVHLGGRLAGRDVLLGLLVGLGLLLGVRPEDETRVAVEFRGDVPVLVDGDGAVTDHDERPLRAVLGRHLDLLVGLRGRLRVRGDVRDDRLPVPARADHEDAVVVVVSGHRRRPLGADFDGGARLRVQRERAPVDGRERGEVEAPVEDARRVPGRPGLDFHAIQHGLALDLVVDDGAVLHVERDVRPAVRGRFLCVCPVLRGDCRRRYRTGDDQHCHRDCRDSLVHCISGRSACP